MDYRKTELKEIETVNVGSTYVSEYGCVYDCVDVDEKCVYLQSKYWHDEEEIDIEFFKGYFKCLDGNPVCVHELNVGDIFVGEDFCEYVKLIHGDTLVYAVDITNGNTVILSPYYGIQYKNLKGYCV